MLTLLSAALSEAPRYWPKFSGARTVVTLDGEWAFGRKEGKGVLTFANGDTFAGYWAQGIINGPGMLTLHAESPWNTPDL